MSAWRKAVELDSPSGGGHSRLRRAGTGYRLLIEPGELDLDQFSAGVTDGRAAGAAGNIRAGAARLGEALALWRGPPLADLAGLSAIAAARGQPERAVMLSGAARALEGELGGGIGAEVLRLTQLAHNAWEQLEPGQAQRAWDSGHGMSRQQAVMAALAGS